ncbi:MAG: hypothetical protein FVQ79_09250 [Planctomycetes bacterium]|nr:hypothetical protein [Planctomycetota bacterium]
MSEKDKRAIRLGLIVAIIVIAFVGVEKLLEDYKAVKNTLDSRRNEVVQVMPDKDGNLSAKQKGLLSVVPAFEMPAQEEVPGAKFRQKFLEQLKKAGIKSPVPSFVKAPKSKNALGLRPMKLQCKGKCKFDQSLDLLASLYDNPLFVAVEEFKIECDPKKRTEMELSMVVTTFVK